MDVPTSVDVPSSAASTGKKNPMDVSWSVEVPSSTGTKTLMNEPCSAVVQSSTAASVKKTLTDDLPPWDARCASRRAVPLARRWTCPRRKLFQHRGTVQPTTSSAKEFLWTTNYSQIGLPSLPTETHFRRELANEGVVSEEYVALTSYQSCRSRLVPLSVVSVTLGYDFETVWEKRGSTGPSRRALVCHASPTSTPWTSESASGEIILIFCSVKASSVLTVIFFALLMETTGVVIHCWIYQAFDVDFVLNFEG